MRIEGRLDDPAVAIQLTLTQGRWMGTQVDRLSADLRVDQRHMVIQTLDSHSAWGDLHASGSIGFAPLLDKRAHQGATGPESLTYDMTIRGENLQPTRIAQLSFPWSGAFGLNLRIDGNGLGDPGSAGKVVAQVQASRIGWTSSPEPVAGQLSTELQWRGKIVDVMQATAKMGSTQLAATARIDFATGRIDTGRARLSAPRLQEVGVLLGAPGIAGSGTLQVDCNGPLAHPNARIELLVRDLAVGQWPLGRLLAQGSIDEQGRVQIPRLVLENQGSLIEGAGHLTLQDAGGKFVSDPGLSFSLALTQMEPADFSLHWPVDARLNGRLTLDGSLRRLNAALALDKSVVRWKDRDFLVQGAARWHDGVLTVDPLTLSKDASTLALKGAVQWRDSLTRQWRKSPLVQAQLVSHNLHLENFDSNLKGTATAQARLNGPLEQLSGNFNVSAADLDLWGQPLHAATLSGRIADKTVFLDTLEFDVTADQTVAGSGRMGLDQQFMLTLDTSGVDLGHIPAVQRAYPVAGQMVLHIDGQGTVSNPALSAKMTIRKPRLDGRPWNDFVFDLQLRDQRLDVAADLNFMLKTSARIDSGMFELQANFDHADLSPYLALMGGATWNGQLTGQVQAAGNWRQLKDVRGQFIVDEAALGYQDLTVLRVKGLNARLRSGTLDLPATRLELLHEGYLDLSASTDSDGQLRTSLNGRLPLAALAPFSDVLAESQGDVTIQAGSQGLMASMQWQAMVTFEGVGLVVPGIDQSVHDIHGSLRFSPGSVAVERLTGAMDGGQFTLAGQLALDGWIPKQGRLTFEAQALPLQWPETLDAVINAQLSLEAGAQGAVLGGRIVALEGSYHKDVRLNLFSAVTQTRRSRPAPGAARITGPLGDIRLDVAVTHRNPFLVDNNVARLEIAPDLKLTGTVARPVVSGRATVTEGDIIFRRKTFSVKRGVVDFVNPYKIEPRLDLSAEAQIRQWLVSLSVTGPPDALVFKLSSDPPESENDILSLILLGRTSAELNQGSSGGQTTQQMLAALVATAWGEDFKRQTGVDILEVETGAGQDAQSTGNIQVTVGKHLSRRLTVKYEVASGSEEMVQRAVSEYRFLEHFLASGFQDNKGMAGGELLFRIEF